jgi:oxygen-independent coproporphyrinogen-3 oxidase
LEGHPIASIYFGGGTPSLFPLGIRSILEKVRKDSTLTPDCEITVEANPEESDRPLFEQLRSFGVNRISLGVQSLDDRSLQTLERTHTAQRATEAILAAKEAQFQNITIDLMYDLPDQTEASWQYTLDRLSALPIQHLSLYNLTIEPHTSFFKRRQELRLPDAEKSLRLLERGVQVIEAMGFKRYEISAFAKNGFQSRHNLGYWTARPFLGFGPSACSYWAGERFRNTAHLQRYTRRLRQGEDAVDFREKLPYPQNSNEQLAVRLRLLEGAPLELIPDTTLNTVDQLIQANFLRRFSGRVQLTDKGLLFYDTVASEII